MNINIDELAYSLHSTATEKGFWDSNNGINFYIKQIAMCHSELSETLEALRKQKGQDVVVEELADTIIRILDLWAGMKRDGVVKDSLQEALLLKANYNTTRPKMHGVLA